MFVCIFLCCFDRFDFDFVLYTCFKLGPNHLDSEVLISGSKLILGVGMARTVYLSLNSFRQV